jgi:hypothetical protein
LAPALWAAEPDPQPEPEAGDKEDIVVTGKAVDRREVTRQARSISRDTDVRHTALARFEGRICPGVIGLQREAAELMVGRLRMIADDLDIPQADETKCSPNIIIAFTEDGRADLAALQRRDRSISQVVSQRELRELLEEPGPVRVFSIVETTLRNGMPVPRRRDLVNVPVARMEGGQSLISTATREDIVGVMVLFDREEAYGKTVIQLADYAAMRAFARTRDAEGEEAPDSILALFDPANPAPAEELTAFDRAYLGTLYEGVPHIRGISKLLRVGATLEKQQKASE